MRRITVRVVTRSGAPSVEERPDGTLVIRVRAAPVGGAATEEAARALASHLGVPRSTISLRVGARSRTKVFEVPGNSL